MCGMPILLRKGGGLQRPRGIHMEWSGGKWCLSPLKIMPTIVNTLGILQTLKMTSSSNLAQHPGSKCCIQALRSCILSLPCLWLFVVATPLIWVRNNLLGTLPNIWGFEPIHVWSWLNLLILSPSIHRSIFWGCESRCLRVVSHQMTHFS